MQESQVYKWLNMTNRNLKCRHTSLPDAFRGCCHLSQKLEQETLLRLWWRKVIGSQVHTVPFLVPTFSPHQMSYPLLFKSNQLESIIHYINFYQVIKTNASYQYCALAKVIRGEEMKPATLARNTLKWRTDSEQNFFPYFEMIYLRQ